MGTPSSSPSQSASSSASASVSASPSATASASPSAERAAEQLVTLAEAKLQLRVTATDEDALIDAYIDAATSWAEKYQQRKYITQTCVDYLDAWPAVAIRPKWMPLASVTSIQYVDASGVAQTWDADDYDVDTASEPGRIAPAYGESWPSIRGDRNGIIVTYEAGYGDSDDVPGQIKTAVLLLVAHWYAHREAVSELGMAEMPLGAKALLGMERMGGV